jgi:NTE family protein
MTGTALVLAGGGERVVGWELGVLAGLRESGLDLTAADLVLGTSAGAVVGTLVAAGVEPEGALDRLAARNGNGSSPRPGAVAAFGDALEVWLGAAQHGVREQRRRVGAFALEAAGGEEEFVAAVAARLPAGGWPAALAPVAIDAASGERRAFRATDGIALERAVAASRAIPGMRPPVTIAGRAYIDGAVGSATNADLAAGAGRVVVVSPTPADPPPGTLFAIWNAALDREIAALKRAGSEVLLIQAGDADGYAMGPDLMSGARAHEAFARGVSASIDRRCRR